MGFKLSRLAQAVIAIAFYSTSSFAAEKTDDFYIEIKGPESSIQQPPQTKPLVIKTGADARTPQPYIPENRDKSIISTKNSTYGPVRSTDTTWSIANSIRKLYPNQNFSTQKVMQALYRKNPHAFVNGKLTNLLAGSRLAIPSADEIKVNSKKKAQQTPINTVKTKKKEILPAEKSRIDPVLQITPADNPTTVAPIAATPVTTAASSSVVASTEPSLVDSKVSELVGSTDTHPVVSSATTTEASHPAENEALLVYQTENKELKSRIQQLNEQVGHLQAGIQNQEELKQELADLQAKLKELEQAKLVSPEKAANTAAPDIEENKEQKSGFWNDILATPLNLLLLISLPVLAVLVVLSFWLRSRAKREMAAREQELLESTTLMMDENTNDFSDLLAVDLSDEKAAFPDLNLEDESLIPASISQDAEIKENESNEKDMSFTANVADVEPAIIEELPPVTREAIDLNLAEDEQDEPSKGSNTPDFSALLSDADLANALEDDFVFSASEPLPSEPMQSFDLSMESEKDDAELVTRLNLDKVLADPGVKMSDQLVSEPDGWELPEDDSQPVELVSTAQSGVNLQEVNNDSGKPWLQQFENEQLDTNQATEVPDDYLSIDELLEQADKQDLNAANNPDSMQPNLDIGLDEFPDMLPEHDGVDIDDDGGVGAKLDLARAYLEIDDKASAKELLLEVQTAGSSEQIKEAEKLLTRIA